MLDIADHYQVGYGGINEVDEAKLRGKEGRKGWTLAEFKRS